MQNKIIINQDNFKGSNKGPNNGDNKGCKYKSSKTKAISVRNNTSKIFLQS